ncbi:hypothetical protein HX867_34610, partial [Pseudomonas gingeri]|nr:hypothetical protein [Pseudomonas gingeri]
NRARIRLVLPLDSDGRACDLQIESAAFKDGSRARFSWERDNQDAVGGYRCEVAGPGLEKWSLPGLWRLEHRLSEDACHLALIPFTDTPAMADRVVVADPRTHRLIDGPAARLTELVDFRDSILSVAVVRGRQPR